MLAEDVWDVCALSDGCAICCGGEEPHALASLEICGMPNVGSLRQTTELVTWWLHQSVEYMDTTTLPIQS